LVRQVDSADPAVAETIADWAATKGTVGIRIFLIPTVSSDPPAPPDDWADPPKLLALAAHPNVVVKISGACTLSHEAFPYKDIWDPLFRVFDAFGLNRCM
jgi:hypothetical protein